VATIDTLLRPETCAMLLVGFQAGLGFGVESASRQVLLNNSFSALSALDDGFDVFVVADACGGLTLASHELALRRLEQAGARLCSWIQVLLELQRDWTRHATYDAARAIVVANGGGYGMGLAYAREMIQPA
jgi:nicotinamidase-related amidase